MSNIGCETNGVYEHTCKLETCLHSVFWNEIPDRINGTSQKLQDFKRDLNIAVATVKSLQTFLELKHECFNEYEWQQAEKSGTTEYVQACQCQHNVWLNPRDDGLTPEAELSPSQRFCAESYIPVIDTFLSSLAQPLSASELTCSQFSFFRQLETLSLEEIQVAAQIYVYIYIYIYILFKKEKIKHSNKFWMLPNSMTIMVSVWVAYLGEGVQDGGKTPIFSM